MKKLKQLLFIALIAVMTFTLAACGSCESCSSCSSSNVSELSVSTTSAKTEYYVGEEFSSDGIIVTAFYKDETSATISAEDYTVDSSAYDKTTVGSYDIVVSYDGVSTTYAVKVVIAPVTAIELDTSNITTEIYLAQSYDFSGLTAIATIADGTTATIGSADLTIDSSAIDVYTAGAYKVGVSYTLGTGTATDEFIFTVLDYEGNAYGGLEITKTTTNYTLESASGFTLSTDDVAVSLVTDSGKTAITEGLTYTLKQGHDPLDGFDITHEGKYQLCVHYDYTIPDVTDKDGGAYTYPIDSFIFINVFDEVSSITLSNSETGTFTQEASTEDSMTSTWQYTLTYASGITETIYGDDANLSFSGLSTSTVASGATATVTYTQIDAVGESNTVSCNVTYTITASQSGYENVSINISTVYSVTASGSTATATLGSEIVSGSGVYIGGWSGSSSSVTFYSVDYSKKGLVTNTSTEYLARLKFGSGITFNGSSNLTNSDVCNGLTIITLSSATISVYVRSSSSTATRTVALYDTSRTQLGTGTVNTSASSSTDYVYKIDFTVSAAGTYFFGSTSSGIGVYAIEVTY